jgi:ATP-dependent RNA helicase DeaD
VTELEQLHLSPSVAAAVDRLGWRTDDPALRDVAPTAGRGHNLVLVAPPSPAYAVPALAGMASRLGGGTRGVLLCAEAQLPEWGTLAVAVAGGLRVQVAQGTARAMRRLKAGEIDLLVTSPETALALHQRSALAPDSTGAVFLAWPETWESPESLTPIMQDLPKDAQRIVVTASPDGAAALVERYARRALTVGLAPPPVPQGPVRTVGVPWERRARALGDLIEILDPATAVVWTLDRSRHDEIARAIPVGDAGVRLVVGDAPKASVIVAFDLPTPERLTQLLGAGQVALMVPPGAEPYVERIAAPRRPVRLPGMVDSLTAEAATRRAAVVSAIESQPPHAASFVLAPLFERYDPTAVAAALYNLWTATPAAAAAAPPPPQTAATAKIYVGIGKNDGATVNDLVAVLTKEVRVERDKIGRVELRDSYALVELPAADAERIAAALSRSTIRRKRVTARVDRGPSKPKPKPRK